MLFIERASEVRAVFGRSRDWRVSMRMSLSLSMSMPPGCSVVYGQVSSISRVNDDEMRSKTICLECLPLGLNEGSRGLNENHSRVYIQGLKGGLGSLP